VHRVTISYSRQQEEVNDYFRARSSYWKDIYYSSGVQAEIYRERQAVTLAWIDDLALAPGSRVLEVGCGAGFLSVALARRGLHVLAIDSSEAMVELARQHATGSGTSEMLSVEVGDVYALPFEDGSFDLVLAIGVIPWLARPELAIGEMARVTRLGGHAFLTADNRAQLIYQLDPLMNPILAPFKQPVKDMLERIGLFHLAQDKTKETLYDCRFIDEAMTSDKLVKTRSMTLGFGPFTFLRHRLIPKFLDLALHYRLQHLASRNVPIFRFRGSHYLVLARKMAPVPPDRSMSADLSRAPKKHY